MDGSILSRNPATNTHSDRCAQVFGGCLSFVSAAGNSYNSQTHGRNVLAVSMWRMLLRRCRIFEIPTNYPFKLPPSKLPPFKPLRPGPWRLFRFSKYRWQLLQLSNPWAQRFGWFSVPSAIIKKITWNPKYKIQNTQLLWLPKQTIIHNYTTLSTFCANPMSSIGILS